MSWFGRLFRRRRRRDLTRWSTADLLKVRADFDGKRAALRQLQTEIVAELERRIPPARGRVTSATRVILEPADAEAEADG